MTMPIQFDATEYVRMLRDGGIPLETAEAHAQALAASLAKTSVAVDSDLVLLRTEMLARLDLMRQEFDYKINALRQEMRCKFMINWVLWGIQFLVDGLILAKLY